MAYQFDESGKLKKLTAEELATADADTASWPIVIDRGVSSKGTSYWVYISVRPSKFEAFMHATKTGEGKILANYGTILRYGFEKEIPANIKDEMRQKYGCDDHYMEHIEKEIRAAQKEFLEKKEDKRIDDIVAMLKKKQG